MLRGLIEVPEISEISSKHGNLPNVSVEGTVEPQPYSDGSEFCRNKKSCLGFICLGCICILTLFKHLSRFIDCCLPFVTSMVMIRNLVSNFMSFPIAPTNLKISNTSSLLVSVLCAFLLSIYGSN